MLRKHKSPGLDSGNPWDSRRVGLGRGRGGYTLVEMLTVMVILSLLMAASNVLFRAPGSMAAEPAARMARCIDLARAQAVAANRSVAIRFDTPAAGSRELVMRFLRSQVGEVAGPVQEFRRPERFADIVISKDVVIPPDRRHPELSVDPKLSHALAPGESLVITTDGQVLLGSDASGFPEASEQLLPAIFLGVQPTRGGQVVASAKSDVAIVQIQCATGTARVMQP